MQIAWTPSAWIGKDAVLCPATFNGCRATQYLTKQSDQNHANHAQQVTSQPDASGACTGFT